MTDDLEALLGTGFMNTISQHQPKNEIIVKKDVENYTDQDLKLKFLSETEDLLLKSGDAVAAALEQATMAPGEGESVAAIASLVNAHARLLDNYGKLYMLQEKHRQAKELLEMKMASQTKMNTENNMTKMTMTREMVMAELMKKGKIVDVEEV